MGKRDPDSVWWPPDWWLKNAKPRKLPNGKVKKSTQPKK